MTKSTAGHGPAAGVHLPAMLRPMMAFLVAPLAVPLLLAAVLSVPGASRTSLDLLVGLIVVIVTYADTFLVGLPTYLFLRKRKWTAFWVSPIGGFAVATATWFALLTLVRCPTCRV